MAISDEGAQAKHREGRFPSRRNPASADIEVVVVEDHPPVRQGLELLLPRQGFRMIGSAGSAQEGARMILARKPDVAVVDVALGDGSGTDLAKAMHDARSESAIVLYTGSTETALIDALVASGGSAVVLKSSPIDHLADAIRAAAAGHHYVDRLVAQMPGRSLAGQRSRRISKREAQVLGMLSQGRTTEQIARELFLSPETIQTHVRNATRKLGAQGRLHAVVLALAHGEIELPAIAR
ncbi:MAG: response regulator transcription factor [Actinobacteria bacterium]|nr:response regulator transcription factor [Actinomycetota bacterium]